MFAASESGLPLPGRGLTPKEVAHLYRVNSDKVRAWIRSGALGAINTAAVQCSKPRFIILPHHLEDFERRRSAAPVPKPAKRQKRKEIIDYYPG